MPNTIRDGKGSGHLAEVNSENKLMTRSIIGTAEHHINVIHGDAYHLLFDQTPTGTANCFVYMKNTHSTLTIVVEGIWFRVASAEQVYTMLDVTGTASGTVVVPANCNAGSAKTADGTFVTGNDITGLSSGITVEKYWLTSAATNHFNFEQDIVVPKNTTFALYATTGGIAVSGTIVFNYTEF